MYRAGEGPSIPRIGSGTSSVEGLGWIWLMNSTRPAAVGGMSRAGSLMTVITKAFRGSESSSPQALRFLKREGRLEVRAGQVGPQCPARHLLIAEQLPPADAEQREVGVRGPL